MKFVCGGVLSILGLALPLSATAQSGLVRVGEEIVVRFPPRSLSPLISSSPPLRSTSASLSQTASPRGSLEVLSIAPPQSAASLASVPHPKGRSFAVTPATPAITLRCREIKAMTPDAICEPNWVVFTSALPNDPDRASQYALANLDMADAWDHTTGSADVKVAVIDTGVDYTHPDLLGNIARNTAEIPANGIDDDRNGFTDDFLGFNAIDGDGDPFDLNEHGTHVAGTIGAVGNNGAGVVGMNWRVGLVPVRVLDAAGSGTIADIVSGIEYAITRGVQIINLSLGGADYSAVFEQAIDATKDANILTVVAAGNEGSVNDFYESFPANFKSSNVVSVAAVDNANALAFFSNIGPATVDLGAPGVEILSTVPGGGYDRFDGTSMAAPHVAGVAALLLAINPRFSYLDLRNLLLETVTPTGELEGLVVTGGILNGGAAVEAALRRTPTRLSLGLTVQLSRLSSHLVAQVRDRDGGRAGIRVSFQCSKGGAFTATTKRSGKATVKISNLTTSQRPTTCRAKTLNVRTAARSRLLKISAR